MNLSPLEGPIASSGLRECLAVTRGLLATRIALATADRRDLPFSLDVT